jgi:hypothetical protein
MLGEVRKVLDVEGSKRKIIDKAAGGYPGVVLRARPSAPWRASLELAHFLRHRFVVCQDADMLTPSGQFVSAAGTQLRSTRHFISSPDRDEGNAHRVARQGRPQLVRKAIAQAERRDISVEDD